VQLGDNTSLGANWGQQTIETHFGAGEKSLKEKILREPGAPIMSLIKHDGWGLNPCAESIQAALFPLFISFTATGPHQDRKKSPPSLLLLNTNFSLLNTIFQQKTSGKWKMGQTATKNCK
jgi:hypothetical protein